MSQVRRTKEVFYVEKLTVPISIANIAKPDTKTVSWNPKEYKIVNIDLEKGEIVFKLKN